MASNDSNQLTIDAGGTYTYGTEIKEDGTRKHVAYVRSGSVGTFYINGVAVATGTGVPITDGGNLEIGTF